jgi:hypothetical protein
VNEPQAFFAKPESVEKESAEDETMMQVSEHEIVVDVGRHEAAPSVSALRQSLLFD